MSKLSNPPKVALPQWNFYQLLFNFHLRPKREILMSQALSGLFVCDAIGGSSDFPFRLSISAGDLELAKSVWSTTLIYEHRPMPLAVPLELHKGEVISVRIENAPVVPTRKWNRGRIVLTGRIQSGSKTRFLKSR